MATSLNSSILGTRARKPRSTTTGGEHNATIIVRVPRELRVQVESAAKAEFLPVGAWVRRAMRAQLRKKVSL
jgi:hypothetical protein